MVGPRSSSQIMRFIDSISGNADLYCRMHSLYPSSKPILWHLIMLSIEFCSANAFEHGSVYISRICLDIGLDAIAINGYRGAVLGGG